MIQSPLNGPVFQPSHQNHSSGLHRGNHQSAESHSSVKTISTVATTVEISGGSRSLVNERSHGVGAYQAVQTVGQVAEPAEEANPFAQTILSFISLQLQRDVANGASQEELQSRLEAGLRGFEEGYSEAYNQLKDSGLLDDGVKSAIEETFAQVRSGVVDMAQQYGLESPIVGSAEVQAPVYVAAPAATISTRVSIDAVEQRYTQSYRDMQTIKHMQQIGQYANTYENIQQSRSERVDQSYSYAVSESRDFQFKLRTQDGDEITVRISNSQEGKAVHQSSGAGTAQSSSLSLSGAQSSGFEIDIDGELDAGELDAISGLLNQVGDISEAFYSGDLDQALGLASNIDFDTGELSSFNLKLNMTSSEQSSQASRYTGPAHSANALQQIPSLEPFVHEVQKAGDMAERLGQSRMMVPDMMEWVGRTRFDSSPHTPLFGPLGRAVV